MSDPGIRERVARAAAETMHGRLVTDEYMHTPATGAHVFWKIADAVLAVLADGWQPIETAPKDGSYVLLRFPGPFIDRESPGVAVGKAIYGGGWWLTAIWAASTAAHPPTQWRPLPHPPRLNTPSSEKDGK